MSVRTPAQIQRFLDDTAHRFDLPSQYLGDEPNSYRRDWDSSAVRWIVAASWPYEAAAGNQSIPAVYKAINEATSPWGSHYLADRWYLPATPRDLKMFERAGIPVFGIESKRQFADFDVVSTSIAYALLAISFIKWWMLFACTDCTLPNTPGACTSSRCSSEVISKRSVMMS